MKTGLSSFAALGAAIDQQIESKRDFVIESEAIEMNADGETITATTDSEKLELELTPTAHTQIAQATGIHGTYYRKMLNSDRGLLALNVNRWLQQHGSKTHVLRTMGSTARAFLGGGYEIIDHDQLLARLYPELEKLSGDLELLSTDITNHRLYVKLAFPKLEGEVREGDIIRSGVTITNSETGEGGLNVFPANFRLICTNGMTRMEQGQRLRVKHSGSRLRELGEILDRERAEVKLDKFIEHFSAAKDEAKFQQTLEQMRKSTERRIEISADELMDRARKLFGFTLEEQKYALNHLLFSEDLTAYGLMNSITRTAHDPDSYDRASDLEAIGSRVLSMSDTTWRELAAIAS